MAQSAAAEQRSSSLRRVLVPLALAQFICSFAGSNMNVMISDISEDLDTTVQGVQIAMTIFFLLVMAALMIPGGKLTDKYGRERLFILGLIVYGVGALMSALSSGPGNPDLGELHPGGHRYGAPDPAGLHPRKLYFTDVTSRARAFGVISAAGGIGAAAGPLIGGLITLRHHLAGRLHLPGLDHRCDRFAQPKPDRSAAARPNPAVRDRRCGAPAIGLVLVVTGIRRQTTMSG